MNCQHHNKTGDNYGMTCSDCGVVLEGYGTFAEGSKTCHHKFVKGLLMGDKDNNEYCIYCEAPRYIGHAEE